jgi:hypothetical protein
VSWLLPAMGSLEAPRSRLGVGIAAETSLMRCRADTATQLEHVVYLFVLTSEVVLPNFAVTGRFCASQSLRM